MKSYNLNLSVSVRLVLLVCYLSYLLFVPVVSVESAQQSDVETPEVELYQNDAGEWKVRYLNMTSSTEKTNGVDVPALSDKQASEAVELYQNDSGEWKVKYHSDKDQIQKPSQVSIQKNENPQALTEVKKPSVTRKTKTIEEEINDQIKVQSQALPVEPKKASQIKTDNVAKTVQSSRPEITKDSVEKSDSVTLDEFTALSEKIESSLSDDFSEESGEDDTVSLNQDVKGVDQQAVPDTVAAVQTSRMDQADESVELDDSADDQGERSFQYAKSIPINEDELEQAEEIELDEESQESDDNTYSMMNDDSAVYLQQGSHRNPKHHLEVGADVFLYDFEQESIENNLGFDIGKTNEGTLYGLHFGYEYVPGHPFKESLRDVFKNIDAVNRYKVTLDYRTGPSEYGDKNNNVLEEKFNQQMLEGRAIGGYDFRLNDSTRLTPFIGLGYRYQLDPSGNIIDAPQSSILDISTMTTFSSVGFSLRQPYEVHTHYLYLPVGLMSNTDISDSWSLGVNLEFDVLLWGMIKNDLADLGTLYVEDVASDPLTMKFKNTSNTLREGIGFRGATRLTKKQRNYDWYIEPFIRYWRINESNKEQLPFKVSDGTDRILFRSNLSEPYNWTEPESATTEYGIQVGVSY